MPAEWSYGSAGAGAAVGKRTRALYLAARKFDPATRQLVLRDSTWELGSPAVEIVTMTLATPKGSYLPDPTLGPDYELLRNQTRTLRQDWKDSVTKALARFKTTIIEDLKVEVDPPARGRLVYSVEFTDPRANEREPVKLPFTARLAA